MTERSYEDAVEVLKRRFGGRWEGAELDGRDDLADALEQELGYSHADARDAIDAMIRSGQLRYHRAAGDLADGEGVAPVVPVPTGAGEYSGIGAGGLGGAPVVPGVAFGAGYWQIGRDPGASGGASGRAGQVDPTA